jgi:hypothetical protein
MHHDSEKRFPSRQFLAVCVNSISVDILLIVCSGGSFGLDVNGLLRNYLNSRCLVTSTIIAVLPLLAFHWLNTLICRTGLRFGFDRAGSRANFFFRITAGVASALARQGNFSLSNVLNDGLWLLFLDYDNVHSWRSVEAALSSLTGRSWSLVGIEPIGLSSLNRNQKG